MVNFLDIKYSFYFCHNETHTTKHNPSYENWTTDFFADFPCLAL